MCTTRDPGFSKRLNILLLPAGIMLLLITACALFKEKSFYRSDSLFRQSNKLELKQGLDLNAYKIRISHYLDSSSAKFYTEIYPRGNFSYSPSGGFSGQADLLRLSGQTSYLQKILDSSLTDSSLKLSSDLREELKRELRIVKKEKQLKKEIPYWIWLGGTLILLGVGIVYSRKG